MVWDYEGWRRFFSEVPDDDFQRGKHGHAAGCGAIEVVADVVFEQCNIGGAVVFGDADAFAEMEDRFRGVSAAADAGDGGQARIVPAGDVAFLNELEQLALT